MTAESISIVIPLWNRARLIEATIGSLRGLPERGVEVVVVDDGSTDGSAEAAEAALDRTGLSGCARVLRQANAGPGAARNAGARAATGARLMFLDSDDLWMPWTAQTLAGLLRGDATPGLIFMHSVDFVDEAALSGLAPGPLRLERYRDFAHAFDTIVAQAPGFRFGGSWGAPREAFLKAGGFDESIRCSEDLDLCLRLGARCAATVIRDPVMFAYRTESANNITANPVLTVEGYAHMARAERAGRYPGGAGADPRRTRLLSHSAVYAARVAFARGRPGLAYRVTLGAAAAIARDRGWRRLVKLLATPALHLIRPAGFPFRLRPERPR